MDGRPLSAFGHTGVWGSHGPASRHPQPAAPPTFSWRQGLRRWKLKFTSWWSQSVSVKPRLKPHLTSHKLPLKAAAARSRKYTKALRPQTQNRSLVKPKSLFFFPNQFLRGRLIYLPALQIRHVQLLISLGTFCSTYLIIRRRLNSSKYFNSTGLFVRPNHQWATRFALFFPCAVRSVLQAPSPPPPYTRTLPRSRPL